MAAGKVKNLAASVRQRLLNVAKKRGDDFDLVLSRYALERLLYRMSVSQTELHSTSARSLLHLSPRKRSTPACA